MSEQNEIQQDNYSNQTLRDIEERQKVLKDRLILIGQNLVDFREKNEEELLNLKKEVESLKLGFEKMKGFLETISGELSKFAKKDDLNVLRKQAKMFQPMEFALKSDLEKLKKKENK
jgi:hypothetical protein